MQHDRDPFGAPKSQTTSETQDMFTLEGPRSEGLDATPPEFMVVGLNGPKDCRSCVSVLR